MRVISAQEVEEALDYKSLVETLREGFREGAEAPIRHQHVIKSPEGPDSTLLLMPAWQPGRHTGIKIITVAPGNATRGLPSILGAYLLNDGTTGQPLALVDGPTLTVKRTAAASALGADYAARKDASKLLVVGTGAMAPELVKAHASQRPIREVRVWGRSLEKAKAVAARFSDSDLKVKATEDLEGGVRWAEIVSCATMSTEPLVRGEWLSPGQHVDLVGAFKPTMRETDDATVQRARIFVDTFEGALEEGGDIVQPLDSGAITRDHLVADLFDLTHGRHPGRKSEEEITLFKSVGTALEDLVAARLACERASS